MNDYTKGKILFILWKFTLPVITVLGLTGHSRPALGKTLSASIIECKVPISKKGKVCRIYTKTGKRGTVVSVYDKKQSWVATGVIHARRGNKAVVILRETVKPIFAHYGLVVGANEDWNSSFNHNDAW